MSYVCRMPHLTLNTMRCIFGVGGFGLLLLVMREKPAVERDDIKPVAVYCIVTIFGTLTVYIPSVYIPLAAMQALYFCFGLSTSLCVIGLIDRRRIYWIEVMWIYVHYIL